MLEWLGGILQIFAAPQSEEEWLELWHSPPAPQLLLEKFSAHAEHFDVYGTSAAFQDLTDNLSNTHSPSYIMNAGFPDGFPISIEAAMAALVVFQAHCPEGGRGSRNSLRGGGALVTL